MSAFEVIWSKTWDEPVCPPDRCSHSNQFGSEVLSINQRLENHPKRAGYQIHLDGSFCMNCGTDITGHFAVAEALHLCMEQHGWNRRVGERLYELAKLHELELLESPAVPIWCFYAFGWSGSEIHTALNSGKLQPARHSEEVEQLASKIDWRNVYDRSAV